MGEHARRISGCKVGEDFGLCRRLCWGECCVGEDVELGRMWGWADVKLERMSR